MDLLAIGSAVIAIILVPALIALLLLRLFDYVQYQVSRSKQSVSSRSAKVVETSLQSEGHHLLVWRLTAAFGLVLTPFVTWGQRRRLSRLIECAGMTGWQFTQIYCLQWFFSFTCLLIVTWFLYPSLLTVRLSAFMTLLIAMILGWYLPIFWLKRQHQQRLKCMSQQLPFFLDMVGLGLDAGRNLQSSVQLALEHVGAGALHQEWSTMLADMRAGQSRSQALRQLSQRLDLASMRQLISSLIQGEAMGFSLGRIIQVYADQQRAQRLMQAEKQALQAPVKMLFPMALCIFPCTFIVLGFPVVIQLLGQP